MNRNEIDFTERMQTGRDLAMIVRNKGQSTGKRAGCQYPTRSGDFYGEEGETSALFVIRFRVKLSRPRFFRRAA
jgi:hypothetical protein